MGYHYKLTLQEKMEFVLWRLLGNHVSADTKRIACFVIIVLWFGMGRRLLLITLGVTAVILAIFSVFVSVYKLRQKGCGGEQSIVAWNEEFRFSAFGGGKVLCGDGRKMQRFGDLLLIFVVLPENGEEWLPVPCRVFESTLMQIKFRQLVSGEADDMPDSESTVLRGLYQDGEDSLGERLFECRSGVDEELWVKSRQDTEPRIRGKVFVTLASLFLQHYIATVLWLAALIIWNPESVTIRLMLDSLAFGILMILAAWKSDKSRKLWKEARKEKNRKKTVCIREVEIWNSGIVQRVPGEMKQYIRWDDIKEAVESSHVLCVMEKHGTCFMEIIFSELSQSEQKRLKEIFREKGIPWRYKKKWLLPGWAFALMAVAAMYINCFFVAPLLSQWLPDWGEIGYIVLNNTQDDNHQNSEVSESSETEEEDSEIETRGDQLYAEYKIRYQAGKLRNLGLEVEDTVVEELVESVQDSQYLRESVVENPYNDLLYQLGKTWYEDEQTVYSDQLYWCSMDIWELSDAYSEVLQGMMALLQDDCLNDIENICQVTLQADNLSSTEIQLEKQGETYTWEFPMDYFMDARVFGIFNYFLEQESAESDRKSDEKRFYYTTDTIEDYESFVFFCTEEWAERFEKWTEMELETIVTEPQESKN